jgi:hypothetical protein
MRRKPKPPPKPCQLCEENAIAGERFCRGCRANRLADMKSSGYLTNPDQSKPIRERRDRSQVPTGTIGGAPETESME